MIKKMVKSPIMFKAILGFLTSLSSFTFAHASCPNTHANETELDCPWAEIARSTSVLDPLTQSNETKALFKKHAPLFLKQLAQDKKIAGLLDLWGVSRNADESHLEDFIVPVNLLVLFNKLLSSTPFDPTYKYGNAGLTHTYGYLFSNLQTPYGYKRARYVKGEIENGFGITQGLFGGAPKKGTLLSNFSYFIASISLRSRPIKTALLPAEIVSYDYKKLKIERLVETVQSEKGKIQFRTDIVLFPHAQADAPSATNTALLIYTIDEGQGPKLITAFPVQKSFGEGLFKPEQMGEQVAIKIKYNAWLKSTTPIAWVGKREKVELR